MKPFTYSEILEILTVEDKKLLRDGFFPSWLSKMVSSQILDISVLNKLVRNLEESKCSDVKK